MTRLREFLLVCVLIGAAAAAAHADGVLIPGRWPPPDHIDPRIPPPPAFAVKYHHVDVKIEDQLAHTRIDQVFISDYDRDLEATYIFPIPEGAAIKEFKMWMDNEPIPGRVLDADEARRIYEDIVRQRKDPALLEYAGRGIFKASIFPVPARGEARIEIEYTELLVKANNTVSYTYPLNTERFSSRPIESVRVSMDLSSRVSIRNVYSPTHAVSVRRPDENTARISYEEQNTRPDTDLSLYYTVSEDDIGLGLLTFMPEDEDGYFIFLAAPPAEVQEREVEAKDVVFVFDRTGSMSGEKIEQARAALKFCVRTLNSADRFNLIPFNEQPDAVFDGLVRATGDNIETALDRVEGLEAVGGTDINQALATALPMLDSGDRPAYVVFLTDGLPTVGVTGIGHILDNAAEVSPDGVRIFSFGVGFDVNTHFLDKLAVQHKGSTEYVRPSEDIEVKVSRLFEKISYPILTNLAVDFGSMDAFDVFPGTLPDLFKGSQLVMAGRFRGEGRTRITLSGSARGAVHRFTLEQRPEETADLNEFIPLIWAQRKIGYLLEEIRLQGSNQELIDEVVRLSKKYGIITEYTSFLVEEPEMLSSRDFESEATMSLDSYLSASVPMEVGSHAFNQSVNIKDARESKHIRGGRQMYYDAVGNEVEIATVRNVQNKAFFQQKKTWVQADYVEDQEVLKVKAFSKAQFQLLQRDPSLGELMALGEEVLFLVNGNAVQVGPEGAEELSEEQLSDLFGT